MSRVFEQLSWLCGSVGVAALVVAILLVAPSSQLRAATTGTDPYRCVDVDGHKCKVQFPGTPFPYCGFQGGCYIKGSEGTPVTSCSCKLTFAAHPPPQRICSFAACEATYQKP
jgi:hypothetical protein